ncbi:EipB family protein, partial [Salmonella enterica]
LYENGISDDLVLDYGDYAMKGTMIRLEVLPAPRCCARVP